jgi:hypothetical protein
MKCLLLSQEITEYTKQDIDKGFCPEKIYQICCCLRTCFCLSYAIRKENDFYIYFLKNNIAVKFIGKELRFLGPDERSQALLLYKALKKRNIKTNLESWVDSTPGIYIKEYNDFSLFFREFMSINGGQTFLVEDDGKKSDLNNIRLFKKGGNNIKEDGNYFFPLYGVSKPNLLMDHSFLEDNGIKTINFENLKKIHDQILVINYWIDLKSTL